MKIKAINAASLAYLALFFLPQQFVPTKLPPCPRTRPPIPPSNPSLKTMCYTGLRPIWSRCPAHLRYLYNHP